MKKLIYSVWTVMALMTLYAAAGPWIALHGMRQAVERYDAAALNAWIDYPNLRENLKDHFRRRIDQLAGEGGSDVGAYIADQVIEQMVDLAVTPAGLSRMMAGEPPAPGQAGASGAAPQSLFAETRFHYRGTRGFSLWVKDREGRELEFVLHRSGMRWRLDDIRF